MKERVSILHDVFEIDGVDHCFTIAAVTICDGSYDLYSFGTEDYSEINKVVKIGFAFCNTKDKYDPKLGETIAIGRARKNGEIAFAVGNDEYVDTELVELFLHKKSEHIRINPGHYIAAYRRSK